MDIVHKTRTRVRKGVGKGLFLLSNKKGSYALFGDNHFSHYGGLNYILQDQWTLFKTLDDIQLDITPDTTLNKFHSVHRRSAHATEIFRFFNKTLYYEAKDYQGNITIDLDFRRIHENPIEGRNYKIYYEHKAILIEYTHNQETHYLAVRGAHHFTVLNRWEPRRYDYDMSRGQKSDRWIYRALQIECQGKRKLSFTYGQNKETLLRESHTAWEDWELIENRVKQHAQSINTDDSAELSAASFALDAATVRLDHTIQRTGIFAGYPWFFQFWARDELISIQGLILAEKYHLVKEILQVYLERIENDGRLPNMHPPSVLGSADAIGWLWKRYDNFIEELERKKLLWEHYSQEELETVLKKIEHSLKTQQERYERDGLIENRAQETWMDTHGGVGDVRAGARIEIQALTLASLKTVRTIYRILKKGNGKEFKQWEKELATQTKAQFFVEGKLKDGADDNTQRSNIFIAAYAYPELLTKKEWIEAFKNALNSLWLSWGGIASIDKKHPLYCSDYTPQNDRSYHRGDSWYWVNNLAALAMKKIAPEEFADNIHMINTASCKELLWDGVLGHAAEVSSAQEQSSSGCFSQAWSAATLVELLTEMKK